MGKLAANLDWTYVRTFLAVAETGSLTGASKKLGQSQPTIGRHIKALEISLGAELFERKANGFIPTELGISLLEPAQDMALASARFNHIAVGHDERLTGVVRITASKVISNYLLPEIISKIRTKEPEIEIELVPSDSTENLIFRDADIAVRMYRPTQLDIITKHVSDQNMALYASQALLEEYGQPQSFEELSSIPFVGFDKSDLIIRTMRELGFDVARSFFNVRCDDQAVYWRLVCAGCGIGAMQTVIGDYEPKVTKLEYQPKLPSIPMWLAAPGLLRKSARIKRVWDLLSESLVRI